jgi:predicted metal-dependent phosphoesterase TrpH
MNTINNRPPLVDAPRPIAALAAALAGAAGAEATLAAHYELRDALKYQKRAWYVCETVVVWIQGRDRLRVMERATGLERRKVADFTDAGQRALYSETANRYPL